MEPSKYPPVVSSLRVWVGVYEHQWQGGMLGHVEATDLDVYDRLEYSLSAEVNAYFTVDPRLGALKARSTLPAGLHTFQVTVTDGKFTGSGTVTVMVEHYSQDLLQSSVYIR